MTIDLVAPEDKMKGIINCEIIFLNIYPKNLEDKQKNTIFILISFIILNVKGCLH